MLLGLTSRGEAVGRLTTLFERAKFSDHDIATAMKQDAIAALREIRDNLPGGARMRRDLLDVVVLFVSISVVCALPDP